MFPFYHSPDTSHTSCQLFHMHPQVIPVNLNTELTKLSFLKTYDIFQQH
jgi:hypothetical protein